MNIININVITEIGNSFFVLNTMHWEYVHVYMQISDPTSECALQTMSGKCWANVVNVGKKHKNYYVMMTNINPLQVIYFKLGST